MNQHDLVEQAIAEHDEQAQKARHVAAALVEIEAVLAMLAEQVDCGSFNGRRLGRARPHRSPSRG